ncbi:hypothetical protein M758_UG120500 [Ceratodon purpureus]|nr:hypothetical protein M758_UG120500 [Ceratodon purpureus]
MCVFNNVLTNSGNCRLSFQPSNLATWPYHNYRLRSSMINRLCDSTTLVTAPTAITVLAGDQSPSSPYSLYAPVHSPNPKELRQQRSSPDPRPHDIPLHFP